MAGNPRPQKAPSAFDRVERLVGAPLEDIVRTRRFADAAILVVKAQNAGSGLVERGTRFVWHLVNLPTRSDVAKLGRQISVLEEQLRLLSADEQPAPSRPAAQRRRRDRSDS